MKGPKETPAPKTKYEVIYESDNGNVSVWYYDLQITKNGPYKVEIKYTETEKKKIKKDKKQK